MATKRKNPVKADPVVGSVIETVPPAEQTPVEPAQEIPTEQALLPALIGQQKKAQSFAELPNGWRVTFANNSTLEILIDDLTPEIRHKALLHGLKQKLSDAAAMSKDTATGKPANAGEKEAAIRQMADQLRAGDWLQKARTPNGVDGSMLFRALCQLSPNKTPAEIAMQMAGWTKEQKAAVAVNKRVLAILGAMRAEKVKGIDSDALLDSF